LQTGGSQMNWQETVLALMAVGLCVVLPLGIGAAAFLLKWRRGRG